MLIAFLLSTLALIARIIVYFAQQDDSTTVIVPDNLITEAEPWPHEPVLLLAEPSSLPRIIPLSAATTNTAKVIELYRGKADDNEPFHVEQMIPGDTVTQYYCLKARHKDTLTVSFSLTVTDDVRSLADTLQIRVTKLDPDAPTVLCEGLFSVVKDQSYPLVLSKNTAQESIVYYQIDVTLPTSAGNECQGAVLSADFTWSAADPTPEDTTHPADTTSPATPPSPPPGPGPGPIVTTKPAETTRPIDTTTPIETTRPTDTTRPVETISPVETTRPIETTRPADTTKPVETAADTTTADTTTAGTQSPNTTGPVDPGDPGDNLLPKPGFVFVIWPWTILPLLSLLLLIYLLLAFYESKKGGRG